MTSTTYPTLDETSILTAVRVMYQEVAEQPTKEFHFPTGRDACLFVGYPEDELNALPTGAVESFAGVGFPFRGEGIRTGDTVVDVGSGSGVDVLVAARRTGPTGTVYGVDMTEAMLEKARENVRRAGAENVHILEGRADALPLEDESVDVLTSNGVFNLVPDKLRAFQEAFRVLKSGGRMQIADIVLMKPASDASKANPQLWAECIVGAEKNDDYLQSMRSAGFGDVKVIDQLDYFRRSGNETTRRSAEGLGAHTIVITAHKA